MSSRTPDGGISERLRVVEISIARMGTQLENQEEKLEDVRNEIRYVKRSLLALVFTILGGVAVIVVQSALNGFGG